MHDQWQQRLDRMRRILPLPLLAAATAVMYAVPQAAVRPDARLLPGLPLVVAAAVLWTAVTLRPAIRATRGWPALFTLHIALAAVLVGIAPVFGVFAYIGFLFAYGFRRGRLVAFAVTALVCAAAMAGGYPADTASLLAFVLVAAVLLALVLNTSSITGHALEQNAERGRMLAELAAAEERTAALSAQLVAQAREAGIVEERQRLAGEIHDTLAQGLTGIVAQLEAAEQTRDRPEEAARHIALARTLAREGLTEARRSVRALRPEQLEAERLPEALDTLARTWSERSGTPAATTVTGNPVRAPAATEDALFRMAQEALSNVDRHAGATRVQLTLSYLDDTLLLDVADDGRGFRRGPDAPPGYGLTGMRRRIEQVGGGLVVESEPGAGTTVNATVPLEGP